MSSRQYAPTIQTTGIAILRIRSILHRATSGALLGRLERPRFHANGFDIRKRKSTPLVGGG